MPAESLVARAQSTTTPPCDLANRLRAYTACACRPAADPPHRSRRAPAVAEILDSVMSRIPDRHADDLGVEGRVMIGENGTTERPRPAVPSILEPDDEHRRSRAIIENWRRSFSGSAATATIFGSDGAPPELWRARSRAGAGCGRGAPRHSACRSATFSRGFFSQRLPRQRRAQAWLLPRVRSCS